MASKYPVGTGLGAFKTPRSGYQMTIKPKSLIFILEWNAKLDLNSHSLPKDSFYLKPAIPKPSQNNRCGRGVSKHGIRYHLVLSSVVFQCGFPCILTAQKRVWSRKVAKGCLCFHEIYRTFYFLYVLLDIQTLDHKATIHGTALICQVLNTAKLSNRNGSQYLR